MKGKNDVFVLEVEGAFRVRPAVFAIDPKGGGKKVLFRNMTGHQVTIALDAGLVNGASSATLEPVGAAGNADTWGATLKDLQNPTVSKYTVTVLTQVNVCAQGESDPVIIIDP